MKKLLHVIAMGLWGAYALFGVIIIATSGSIGGGAAFILPAAVSFAALKVEKASPKTSQQPKASHPTPKPAVSISPKKGAVSVNYEHMDVEDFLCLGNYVVLDVETTGFSPANDKIIELAALKVVNGEVVDQYSSFVNPGCKIPSRITQLTGITDADVKGAPKINVVIKKFADFRDDFPIVGHNVNFDMSFISVALQNVGIGAEVACVDTLPLARAAFPDLVNHKLATLIKELNLLDHAQEHRALSDVIATNNLFVACQKILNAMVDSDAIEDDDEDEDEYDEGYELNKQGMAYEAQGDILTAIKYFEDSIAAGFCGSHPYQRLAVLYRKQKKFSDEIRICDAAIAKLQDDPYSTKKVESFQHRREVAQTKLQKQF